MRHIFVTASALALAACSSGQAQNDGARKASNAVATGQPVLVELFTSQGCSSCPPADAVLQTISYRPDTVAVSRPVTYWDRLGWKDTLALEANTTLQRDYARRGGVGAGVYTPQAMVQGVDGVVGSQKEKLEALISKAQRTPQPRLSVAGGAVTIEGAAAKPAQVSLLALKKRAVVQIGNGENGGRRVTYTNVLIGERALGNWSGGKTTIAVPAAALRVAGADAYALVLREGAAGRVVAARYL